MNRNKIISYFFLVNSVLDKFSKMVIIIKGYQTLNVIKYKIKIELLVITV